ncbi:hypothetical protein B7P43_G06116 [Cryptotermes secundus]|uniref:PI-PLC X domain-containing protein 1 n=1 Tax=Cryptotermes secundus TaxID=105785 RepID=A0A2J7QQF9_9NEOP|nr:hypothetical protein B7P43_G06116 [Cryptotermes secundus]
MVETFQLTRKGPNNLRLHEPTGFDCNAVFLTVSSLWRPSSHDHGLADRDLELNWEPSCDPAMLPDWVGLFDTNPSTTEIPSPLVKVHPADHHDGFFRTNVSLGRPLLPGGWEFGHNATPTEGDHCFPYWAASFRGDQLVHMDCLKIRPTWMWDHRLQLRSLSLGGLFIPGTHNSACYKGSLTRRDTFSRYLLTQDTGVWGQLVHGIRYLDLRVGYYPPTNKTDTKDHRTRFWVNHDLIRVGPLLPVLREVKQFLQKTMGEVVILDLHRFPVGFHGRPARHRCLVALLTRELKSIALPVSSVSASTLLRDIWDRDDNRRLIVAYGDKNVAAESTWLWGPLSQVWGNQQTPSGLRNFLQRSMDSAKQRSPGLWAAMAELTPTPLDVMFNPTGSLRVMANAVNRNLTSWFRNEWWSHTNIVATDFFLGNNLIDVAVAANLRKINMVES